MNVTKAITAILLLSASISLVGQAGIDPRLLVKAKSGDAEAQVQVGEAYAEGHGVAQDYAEALRWWHLAADKGDASAQDRIGVAYSLGRGVPRDLGQAIVWYRKSAEQGFAAAQSNLGIAYDEGLGVEGDHSQAIVWFKKSAAQGYAAGENRLGLSYYRGHGVAQDYTEAFVWFLKAAQQGWIDAQIDVADSYHKGLGIAKDEAEASSWYRKAADQGDVRSQNELGERYEHGLGVPQDDGKAVEWFRKAADKGNPNAQANLGDMYYQGHGVSKDYAQAIAWYQRAADQGNARAKQVLPTLKEQFATAAASTSQNSSATGRTPLTPQAIAKLASASTVLIVSAQAQNSSVSDKQPTVFLGSGFAMGPGLIVTNSHVFPEGRIGLVRQVGGSQKYSIQAATSRDVDDDLVLLQVPGLDLPPLTLATREPVVGDTVYAMGNPNGMEGTFSEGIVSAVRHLPSTTEIQITAPISHGSSGGPVLNVYGEVVGVSRAVIESGENLNFAVSAQAVTALLKQGPPKAPPQGTERFDVPIPASFKIGSRTSQPEMNTTEMVPNNESVDNWSEMVTSQIIFRLPDPQASKFLASIGKRWASDCPGSAPGNIVSGTANGFPVSMVILICPKNRATGKPETTVFRAIQGAKTLYLIQYAFRHEPTPALVAKATHYLDVINLCSPGSTDHPCPDQRPDTHGSSR